MPHSLHFRFEHTRNNFESVQTRNIFFSIRHFVKMSSIPDESYACNKLNSSLFQSNDAHKLDCSAKDAAYSLTIRSNQN